MKQGNWIPVDQAANVLLPKDRPYTKLEAYFSLRLDMERETQKGLREYGRIWGWAKTRVQRFFVKIGYVGQDKEGEMLQSDRDKTGTKPGHPTVPTGTRIRLVYNKLSVPDGTPPSENRDKTGTKPGHNYNPNPNHIDTRRGGDLVDVVQKSASATPPADDVSRRLKNFMAKFNKGRVAKGLGEIPDVLEKRQQARVLAWLEVDIRNGNNATDLVIANFFASGNWYYTKVKYALSALLDDWELLQEGTNDKANGAITPTKVTPEIIAMAEIMR